MGARIYLVEDEENLNVLLKTYLERDGYEVRGFTAGLPALQCIQDVPDLWVLDIMLPDIDGYLLLKKIKEYRQETPVIFISAKNDQLDRVVGLELGSDDYLPKPFLPRELVMRVQLLLQRTQYGGMAKAETSTETYDLAGYHINKPKRMITTTEAEQVELTHKEWHLLCYFLDNRGLVLSREQILYAIWGENYFGSDRVVDDTMRRLRKKMPQLPLETVYHTGYKLVEV